MTCDQRDQELLLLAHGALSFPRRLAIQAHLRRCAPCRRRLARLTQVSATLSAALSAINRTPWMPGWGLARTRGATFAPRLLLGLTALLVGISTVVLYLAFSGPQASCAHKRTPSSLQSKTGGTLKMLEEHCR